MMDQSEEVMINNKTYELKEELGAGAFGRVYRGVANGNEFAIKCVMDQKQGWNNTEVQIMTSLKKLSNPNLVSLIDWTQKGTKTFIVMDLMEGDLSQYLIRRGTLGLTESQPLVDQIVKGVRALHEANVIHRDLKPQNILTKGSGPNMILKISDFGISKIISPGLENTPYMGTPLYWAPEVLAGKKYDTKADMWSLGVILLQMWTGLKVNQANQLPLCPKGWEILKLLLNKKPEQRVSVEQLLMHPYFGGPGLPPVQRPPPVQGPPTTAIGEKGMDPWLIALAKKTSGKVFVKWQGGALAIVGGCVGLAVAGGLIYNAVAEEREPEQKRRRK